MSSPNRTRILIVHDAPQTAAGLQSLLTAQGCEVNEKQWNARLVEDYRMIFPSVIIFDVPAVDDSLFEACRSLVCSDSPLKPVIILLSHFPTPDSTIQAFDAGVTDIVCRPADLRELTARIMARLRHLYHYDKMHNELRLLEKEIISKTGKLMLAFRTGNASGNGSQPKHGDIDSGSRNPPALSSRIIAMEESNCNRLARELHDCVGQNLTALKLNLNLIRQQLSPELPPGVDQRLKESIDLAAETTQKIRSIMTALRCKVLDFEGLFAALRWEGNRFAARTGLRVDVLGMPVEPRLSPEVETALFRIAQEAMTNVFKHARANQIIITLNEKQGVIHLSIADDGNGFIPEEKAYKPDSGWGLIHMQERVEAQNGILRIVSSPGEGTHIIAAVPR